MILLIHYFQKKLLKDKLYRKSLRRLFEIPYDEIFIGNLDEVSDEKINQYQMIYILSVQIDKSVPVEISQLRRRYTGMLIALFPFIEGLDSESLCNGVISCFDSVITSSYKYITTLRRSSMYSFAKYLPAPLALIKSEGRPIKKSEIRIGFILQSSIESQLSKIIKTIDSLASEGFIVIGLSYEPDSDLYQLQNIQKACPIFMIHNRDARKEKRKKYPSLIDEIKKCTCLISNTYEGFWLGICYNIPVVPLIPNTVERESILSLSHEIGSQNLVSGLTSSKELFKKINSCLEKCDLYTQLQERYLVKSRLILGTIPKLNLIEFKSEIGHISDILQHPDGISMPMYSYFVEYIGNDLKWKRIADHLSYYNQSNGIYFDTDLVTSFKSKVYLFEWIGIIRSGNVNLVENKNFVASLNMCRGLYVFSEQIKKQINKDITSFGLSNVFKVPITTLIYPVLSISQINLNLKRKIVISNLKRNKDPIFDFDFVYLTYSEEIEEDLNGVIIFLFSDLSIPLSNGFLSRCICKEIPVILPKDDAYIELLGYGYPLFWTELSEIESLCQEEKLKEAVEYLRKLPKEVFTLRFFINSIHTSKSLN